MKNAAKHADELRSLIRKQTREHKPPPRQKQEPIRALVRAALSFDLPDSKADDAMKVIDREFVDLNELRVATNLEVQELLGPRYPAIEKRVAPFLKFHVDEDLKKELELQALLQKVADENAEMDRKRAEAEAAGEGKSQSEGEEKT